MLSGLVLNVVQLFVYVLIRPLSKSLYRSINHYLQYSYWSQSVAVADWNSNLNCRIYYKDKQAAEEFGSCSGIAVANHRYDIDWLAAWMLSDKLGTLGGDKAMLKDSLRYVPVIGWGWALGDMIFLSRNWQKDKENLARSIKTLLTYHRSLILAFFEGTRYTKTKYEASVKFAEEKNLPIRLKHHLIPRTRGFNCMVEHIKDELKQNPKLKYGLYNMQIALDDDDNSRASLDAVLSGVPTCVHVYVERLCYDDISVANEEATTQYLYDIYKEKDRLHDYFKKHGKFPGMEVPYKRRVATLANWAAWMITTYSGISYLFYKCIASGSLVGFGSLLSICLLFSFAVKKVVNSTKVSKSSSYGVSSAGDKKDS